MQRKNSVYPEEIQIERYLDTYIQNAQSKKLRVKITAEKSFEITITVGNVPHVMEEKQYIDCGLRFTCTINWWEEKSCILR